MPNSTSLLSFPDCKRALDQALESKKGIKLEFKDTKTAFRFMGRCSTFRKLDRKENAKIYLEPAHSLHGRSIYDALSLKLEGHKVVITRIEATHLQVEEIQ